MSKNAERLAALAVHVGRCNAVADIGTDHGWLPIRLYREGLCRKLILTDIGEGPLARARANVEAVFGEIPSAFSLRQGDGLVPLAKGEADVCVIAGMGGETIAAMMDAAGEKARSIRKYVLQPRSKSDRLRQFLCDNGYRIADEDLVPERGRICEIILAAPLPLQAADSSEKTQPAQPSQEELLRAKNHPLLEEFLENKARIAAQIATARNRPLVQVPRARADCHIKE
ncbi:MAG: class I SAM-dependent methyltransferase [Clostridiales Family XIII bacterium]|nr:class I SAM-dependent methyltransferase [Clostridiales Family XIII bacterium]